MEIIRNTSRDEFYENIRNVLFADNFAIELVNDGVVIATLKLQCNDCMIKMTGRTKNTAYVTGEIKRESGECVPVDEIIDWFESKLN